MRLHSQGGVYVGKLAVWRCPAQLPTDIEVWEAMPFPEGEVVRDNCVIVSVKGYGNSSTLASKVLL